MSFELANASVTFQAHIHEALREYLGVFVVVYLDDILMFSKKNRRACGSRSNDTREASEI